MNLLTGLFVLLCLMAFVSGEGHRSRRQKFKVFRQRRMSGSNLSPKASHRIIEPVTSTQSPPPPPSPTGRSYYNNDHFEYDKLVNSFDQED